MSEQNWFVYQGNQQLGPFSTAQVIQMLDSKMIAQDAYLFKAGWKDWRPIEDCNEELGLKTSAASPSSAERRSAAPRATMQGRVIVHNNGQLIIGSGVNISSSGIFVETQEQIFTVGEKLKLSVRIDGFVKSFNVFARVVRFNSDPRNPVGFGLSFEGLDKNIGDELERLVASKRAENSTKVG
ncbi:MAG: PilZ domain-containing protein [Pseudomonadota bacterium]